MSKAQFHARLELKGRETTYSRSNHSHCFCRLSQKLTKTSMIHFVLMLEAINGSYHCIQMGTRREVVMAISPSTWYWQSTSLGLKARRFILSSIFSRDNYLVLQDGKERRFHALKTESGLVKMLSLEIFNDPSQGYLVDDCCAFGVEIFLNKIERQGGLSLSKNNLSATESTFTWRIDKFSTLPELYESDVFELGGLKWTLRLYAKGKSKEMGKCLSLFLHAHVPSFPCGWNIYAKYKLSILDQLNHIHYEEIDDKDWFSTGIYPGWGYLSFIQLSDLNDPSRGLIVNDTITIQVKFKCISFIKSLT